MPLANSERKRVWMHGGEIACLKGLQGAKGYLQGLDADKP